MQGAEFRGLAEAVTRAYGDEPWFFLRELAQNSRDAGAHAIRVSAVAAGGTETLSFVDDGEGLSLEHARRFLFRLYASDKGSDLAAAGRYGIGFWTVLRFRPATVRIESRHGSEAWALVLDADLNARRDDCTLAHQGTAVTLSRPATVAGDFAAAVEQGLRTYCRYLRRNDRRASPLPLWFAGQNLVEAMALPGPLSLQFSGGAVEGAVGLGEKPLVRLFARGLPVWEGTLLGQMSHLQADPDLRAEVASGLAPVFLLNGNHLDVTFSRSLALENRELERLRRTAKKALDRLVAGALETAFPRHGLQRAWDRLRSAAARWRRPGRRWIAAALLLLVFLEYAALRRFFPVVAAQPRPVWFSLRAAPSSYRGALVAVADAASEPPFSYWPPRPMLFKLFTAEAYDERAGFVRRAGNGRRPAPPGLACPPAEAVSMRLSASAGATLLPLAPGQALVAGSLRLDNRPLSGSFVNELGEAVVELAAGGVLEYRSCQSALSRELAPAEFSRYTALPAAPLLPAAMEQAAAGCRELPVGDRLARALAMIRGSLEYDASPATIARTAALGSDAPWPTRVLIAGGGDCDVLNGFLVVLLRRMAVPARLAVGMVGEGGNVRPALHAWCEYFDHGWAASDATAYAAVTVGPPPQGTAAPAPVEPPRRRRTEPLPWLLFFPLPAALAAWGLLYLAGNRVRTKGAAKASPAEAAAPLMQMVQHAMIQPGAWGDDSPLWRHPLLPLLGGGAVSLARARRLRPGKLFATINRNPLARAMAASGITVLDLGSPGHSPLLALLPNAIDADLLCRLRPELPPPGGLLAALNSVLRGWRGRPPFLAAPGLSGADTLTVSLPARLAAPPFYFPRRFVAVAPHSRRLDQCERLFARNRALAMLRFLQGLGAGIPFSPADLRKAARRLLRCDHE
jgi:hypothetical protein